MVNVTDTSVGLKQTSHKVASDAARVLKDPKATKIDRELAASALDQVVLRYGANLDQTSKKVASDAARVLRDPTATKIQREIAASALEQTQLHG